MNDQTTVTEQSLPSQTAAAKSQPERPAAGTNTRTLAGRVVSTKMQKTVTVLIERKVKHPVFGKYVTRSTKYHAHAETPYRDGDLVEIQEGRPISKTKAWYVSRLIEASRQI